MILTREFITFLGRRPVWFRASSPNYFVYSPLHMVGFPTGFSVSQGLVCLQVRCGQGTSFNAFLSFSRDFQSATPMNGRLLQMYETMQKDKRAKSKKDRLFASFNLIQKIQREGDVNELLEIYEILNNRENFEPSEVTVLSARVALLTRFAVLSTRRTEQDIVADPRVMTAIETLVRTLRWSSASCEATHLASILWAISTLGISEKSYFIHFEREIKNREPKLFTNGDIAMILWGLGKAQFRAPQLFKILRDEILTRDLGNFKVKEICHIVWSYARTLEKGAKLLSAVKEEIMNRDLSEFEERSLVIILWSFSEAGLNVKPLFRFIKLEILRRGLPCFTDQQLAQIVSSYASQNIRSPDLFQEVSDEILSRGKLSFEPVGIVMVAFAFAKTKNFMRDLFKVIERHLMATDLSVFEPLQLIRFLWSFAMAGFMKKALLHKLSDQILLCNFTELNDTSLGELVHMLEECAFDIPELVEATEAELVRRSEACE